MVETEKGHVVDEDREEGTFQEDPYTEKGREKMVEEDEMEGWEEGFSKGYENKQDPGTCDNCGQILVDDDSVVEVDINKKHHVFCSQECADEYIKKKNS